MALLKFRQISLADWQTLEVKDPDTRYIVYNEDESIYGEFIGEEKVTKEVEDLVDNKVDKVSGKSLSTNDFTDLLKIKLDGIEAGAEVNVQSDWTQEVNTADDYIKNKPAIPTKTSDLTNDTGYITGYTETDPLFTAWDKSTGISITKSQVSDLIEATQAISGLMSATDKQRLDVLHALLEEDTENSVVDSINEILAIFNNYPEGADLVSALAGKVDKVTGKGLSTNDYTTTEKNKLAGIAFGAEVNVQSDWTQEVNTADDYIKNKPAIPTKTSDLTNDTGYITGYTETDPLFTAWDKSTGISITKSQITDLIEATQAISGLMSATDKQRLDVLHSLLEEDTENSVVDSINEILAIFNNYPEGADLVTALAGKVDKVTGKGLSTNDFTTTEKNKLSGIQAGAQVNAVTTVAGRTGAVVLTKADVGLSNVDNTSDGTKYVQGLRETRANVNTKIWTGTEAQYDAIVTKDATTLYFITE